MNLHLEMENLFLPSLRLVLFQALTKSVRNHGVQQLFFAFLTRFFALITSTNLLTWCTAKLAEAWTQAGGGRVVPYASCHRLAEVRQASRSIYTNHTCNAPAAVHKRNSDCWIYLVEYV